jgi:hypothetical protein
VRFVHASDEELLCCVCSDHPHWLARVQRGDSAAARSLVRAELARRGQSEVAIQRDELGPGRLGPPRIVGPGADASGWELGLAHDGPWVSFALGHPGLGEPSGADAELVFSPGRARRLVPL